jgi:pimeloyl-ACP methyl ester carboxylesterase
MSGTTTKMRYSMMIWGGAVIAVLAGCQSGPTGPIPSATAPLSGPSGPAGSFDVGGFKLDLTCRGTGSPTVVFESGAGDDRNSWTVYGQTPTFSRPHPSPNIADSFSVRTCVYTRYQQPDPGRSGPPATALRTGADSVRDLHTLLDVAAVPGPYLLVGHSLGGLLVVMYAATYPADVVGLVLLDPTLTTDTWLDGRPASERAAFAEVLAKGSDHIDIFATLEQAKLLVPHLPHVPVLLLAATRRPQLQPNESVELAEQYEAGRKIAERRFVDALPRGELLFVDAGHYVHVDAPQLVIDEVQRIVAMTR